MDGHYYEDPIESYGSDENTRYFTPENCLGGQAAGSYVNNYTYYYDDDDLEAEYGMSSPTPMRVLEPSQNRLYPNHGVQTGMSSRMQVYASNQQQKIFPGFYNNKRSSNFGGPLTVRVAQSQQSGEPSLQYHGNHSVGPGETSLANDQYGRNGQIKLRPVSDLPDKYRSLFKFGIFNAVQSTCYDEVFNGDKNLVISAPTGSGKTVIFELAMIRTLERGLEVRKPAKCIYIAPTKALCMEKFQDWTTKFEPLGFKCSQLTGDTVVFGAGSWGDARHSSILVTTCEKWDSLTRNWNDYDHILSQIELFLVDEVHILNETRGSTLEVVTSRMRLRRPAVRFILVSATVPNIRDVAEWIGAGAGKQEPAMVFEFGDDYRPCKLTRHVVGIPKKNNMNEFQFAKSLDYRLFSTLQKYSVNKPILVFCPTRRGVFGTAEHLMKEYLDNEAKKTALPWFRPARSNHSFSDKRLDGNLSPIPTAVAELHFHVEFASVGIGVHHAGLTLDDRRATEQLYLSKVLRILIATSTLAVGVNLPAHMVVIKGVHTYQNNAVKEYSDLDVMQMLGRAGRPQFDTDGIAVIMCESQLELKYQAMVQGRTVLESSLHLNLAEHLNSEIGLGTITNISLAKEWLRNSFLFQRIQRNPGHYAITATDGRTTSVGDDLVLQSIEQLKQTQLVQTDSEISGGLCSTRFGNIMSKFYVRCATMEQILKLPEHATLREMLETLCAAEEFYDCRLRASERPLYKKLGRDIDIRFEVKKVESTSDKIFILVQAVLGGISLNSPEYKATESQPHLEAFGVFKHIARIARAALDVAIAKKHGAQIKNGLELLRCLTARAWEDRAIVLRQIEHLGEKSIKVLAEHGITSLALLRKQDPLRIEKLLNRRPPFGIEILASVLDLPQYTLVVQEIEVKSGGGNPVEVALRIECGLEETDDSAVRPKKSRNLKFDRTSILTMTSDMEVIDFRRIPSKALHGGKSFEVDFELKKPSQCVTIIITSETVAGVACQQTYKPKISPRAYPVLDTRPISTVEMDIMGLEDDPDFWNMTLDSDSPKRKHRAAIEDDSSGIPEPSIKQKQANRERPDDLYECNHSCKDKTKCRHLCCRDGLPHPPASKKKSQPSQTPKQPASKVKQPIQMQKNQTTIKQSSKDLMQLELTHKRASTVNDFKLPNGQQRLKIESWSSAKQKPRLPVDYDIQFTDLSDPKATRLSGDLPDNLSDEDLPASIVHDKEAPRPKKRRNGNENVEQSDSSQPPRKCPKERIWSSVSTSGSSHTLKTNEERSPIQNMPLFFQSVSSDDEGSIEVSSPVPSFTIARNREHEQSWLGKQTLLDISETTDDLSVPKTEVPAVVPESENYFMNELAKLGEWLESGAFEVV